ncbi:MAG: hemerythrin domain-containing protein, partial [Magnetococcales bacterium]|nr:hemerythrin domain-containing protein [Magnetococcales bacterium]
MEEAAQQGDGKTAERAFRQFALGLARHFTMEEEGFFPAFEKRTGMRQGPTMVMRMEHEQMRGLVQRMFQAVAAADWKELAKIGGTLLILMQQHNMKEEQMLYPMGDMQLAQEADAVVRTMQGL